MVAVIKHQAIDKTALISNSSTSVNVTYCLHGRWEVDHPDTDISTALQPPGKQCTTIKSAPRGENGGCAVATDCSLEGYQDPLIIDLGQDGIHLGEAGVGVYFDMNNDGQKTKMQWVAQGGNEAFLVRDLNKSGIIDHGGELFGNGTILSMQKQVSKPTPLSRRQLFTVEGTYAENGFEALAQFDLPKHGGNGDGIISADDYIWQELSLWLDVNADGVSTPDEMMTLANVGLYEIDVTPKQNNRQDNAGNWIPYWSWATTDNDTGDNKYKIVDVFFKALGEEVF